MRGGNQTVSTFPYMQETKIYLIEEGDEDILFKILDKQLKRRRLPDVQILIRRREGVFIN